LFLALRALPEIPELPTFLVPQHQREGLSTG